MKTQRSLMVIGLAMIVAGCTRYSYPPNTPPTASTLNQDLIASHAAPKVAGVAHLEILGMACLGADYTVKVHYEQGFESVQFLDLQYQVLPKSSNSTHLFTQPTGQLEIKPPAPAGDVTLTIPGDKVPGKDSDVLFRLKLKTLTIVEFLSPQEQIHIGDVCK